MAFVTFSPIFLACFSSFSSWDVLSAASIFKVLTHNSKTQQVFQAWDILIKREFSQRESGLKVLKNLANGHNLLFYLKLGHVSCSLAFRHVALIKSVDVHSSIELICNVVKRGSFITKEVKFRTTWVNTVGEGMQPQETAFLQQIFESRTHKLV